MKNLCDNCKLMKEKTTDYCTPYNYDEKGNVICCQSYEPYKENVIKCIINFIKKND
jgi:hypothetical protein